MTIPLLSLLFTLGCGSSIEEADAAPPPVETPSVDAPTGAPPPAPPAGQPPAAAPAPDKPTPPAASDKMHDRFREAFGAHDALLMGDLTSFREQMSRLARDGGVAGQDAKNASFSEVAATAAMAANAEEAALGFAKTGAACGACHATVGFPYHPATPAPPEVEADVISHMTRHFWASERMWEGLVSGQDASWNAGAAALDEGHLVASELPPIEGADANALAREVHTAGQAARDAVTTEQRIAAYSRLVATCQACHTRLERPPGTELTP